MVFNKHRQEGQEKAMCLEDADEFDLAEQRPGPLRGCWDNRLRFSSLGLGEGNLHGYVRRLERRCLKL